MKYMNKRILFGIVLLSFVFIMSSVRADICQNLNTPYQIVTLTSGVESTSACFIITADNTTLDCNGYNITTTGINSYPVDITQAVRNVTIKNCNISAYDAYYGIAIRHDYTNETNILFNNITTYGNGGGGGILLSFSNYYNISNNIITSVGNNHGIQASSLSNSSINNNTIRTLGSRTQGIGIYIYGSSYNNTLLYNDVISNNTAIYMDSCINCNIMGGSYHAIKLDYFLNVINTNFTDTNFTAARNISISKWFNYNNETNGNIWLKTSASSLTRFLSLWSNTTMRWNDTNSSKGLTVRYNLTGLQTNTGYSIYNTSNGVRTNPYIYKTDGNGDLPSFTILLNGNTEISVENITIISGVVNMSYSGSTQTLNFTLSNFLTTLQARWENIWNNTGFGGNLQFLANVVYPKSRNIYYNRSYTFTNPTFGALNVTGINATNSIKFNGVTKTVSEGSASLGSDFIFIHNGTISSKNNDTIASDTAEFGSGIPVNQTETGDIISNGTGGNILSHNTTILSFSPVDGSICSDCGYTAIWNSSINDSQVVTGIFIKVLSSGTWVTLNVLTTSTCDSSTPSFSNTTVGSKVYECCAKNTNGDANNRIDYVKCRHSI